MSTQSVDSPSCLSPLSSLFWLRSLKANSLRVFVQSALVMGLSVGKRSIVGLSVGFLVVGCGGVERARGASPAEELYLQGIDALNDQDFLTATERFRVVKTKHVYTRYAALAELKLADVQFEQGRYLEAISLYELFMQGRPNHQKVPYAAWRVAEGYVKQRPSDFILNPPAHERDRGPTRDALRALNSYLERFPEGEHAQEAQAYRAACRATLAEYELYVARFYRNRDELKASEGRYQALLSAFEDVPQLWREGAKELIALYKDSERTEEAEALKARLKAFKASPQISPQTSAQE